MHGSFRLALSNKVSIPVTLGVYAPLRRYFFERLAWKFPHTSCRLGERALNQAAQDSGHDAGGGASEPPKKRKGNSASPTLTQAGGDAQPSSTAHPSPAAQPFARSTHPPAPGRLPPLSPASRASVPSRNMLASGYRTRSVAKRAEALRLSRLRLARETAADGATRGWESG